MLWAPTPAMMGKSGPTAFLAVAMRVDRSERVSRKASAFVPRMTRPARPVVLRYLKNSDWEGRSRSSVSRLKKVTAGHLDIRVSSTDMIRSVIIFVTKRRLEALCFSVC